MLRVKTKIGQSKIHGIGLFADQFIPKGTITWEYDAGFDMGYSDGQINKSLPITKEYFLFYCYYDKEIKRFILCCDNQKFINHSIKRENILSTPRRDIAKRDIQIGEEMLCDYNKFDDGYWKRHNINPNSLR